MPEVREQDVSAVEDFPCSHCETFSGAIWLCGEGMLCESCFSSLAGIPEEDAFGSAQDDKQVRQRVKEALNGS